MPKIGCFKQNHCILGMPPCIPMQFFTLRWWKTCCCDKSCTYSQRFAANFNFSKISLAAKVLRMLKISCFKQNHCISGMPPCIPMQFFTLRWWKTCCCDQSCTYSQRFAANFNFSKIVVVTSLAHIHRGH